MARTQTRLAMLQVPPGMEKAFVEPDDPPTPGSLATRFFSMESGDLLDAMGLSGMAVMCGSDKDFRYLILVALQSFTLQYTILYALFKIIWRTMIANEERRLREHEEGPQEMSWMLYIILFVAIHLHFLSCFGDIPFALNILLRIRDIHDTPKELTIAAPIFFIDALLTPLLQLIIGALFVVTSPTAVDVLLNSCAVAFISNIDDWILTLMYRMKTLSGDKSDVEVYIPHNPGFSKMMELLVVVCPILPCIFSMSMIRLGEFLGIAPSGSGQ